MTADRLLPRGRPWVFPWVRRLARRLLFARYLLFHRRRYDRHVEEEVGGLRLTIEPGVFNPALLLTGEFMARELAGERLPLGADVLDLGCGSGLGALLASTRAEHIVAADINPAALRCTLANVRRHGVENKVEVVESDLFSALEARHFDVVLFNPPFYRGAPKDDLDRAWRGEQLFERFAEALPAHLKPGGCAYVVFSSDGDLAGLLAALGADELRCELVAEHDRINEILLLYEVRLARTDR